MRTTIISFVMASDQRKKIVDALFRYPKRLWSCSSLEEASKLPHATVFRTIQGLQHFGLLKGIKINKKDIAYEVVSQSPLFPEVRNVLGLERRTAVSLATIFSKILVKRDIQAILLYGSGASGQMRAGSDVDILVVLRKSSLPIRKMILDVAARFSSEVNTTIAANIMTLQEIRREKNRQFIRSIQQNNELIYGKTPF